MSAMPPPPTSALRMPVRRGRLRLKYTTKPSNNASNETNTAPRDLLMSMAVAAGSVVRGAVPDRCVVAGVPARVVREYVAGDGWSPRRTPADDPG